MVFARIWKVSSEGTCGDFEEAVGFKGVLCYCACVPNVRCVHAREMGEGAVGGAVWPRDQKAHCTILSAFVWDMLVRKIRQEGIEMSALSAQTTPGLPPA